MHHPGYSLLEISYHPVSQNHFGPTGRRLKVKEKKWRVYLRFLFIRQLQFNLPLSCVTLKAMLAGKWKWIVKRLGPEQN